MIKTKFNETVIAAGATPKEIVAALDPMIKSVADKAWNNHPNNPKNKSTTRPTVHKSLLLPSTYESRTKIDGNLRNGAFVELRRLYSQTGGHEHVWAARFSGQNWKEISSKEFTQFASEIIGVENWVNEHEAINDVAEAGIKLESALSKFISDTAGKFEDLDEAQSAFNRAANHLAAVRKGTK